MGQISVLFISNKKFLFYCWTDRGVSTPTFSCQIYKEMIKYHSFPASGTFPSKHYFLTLFPTSGKTNLLIVFSYFVQIWKDFEGGEN